MDFDPKNGVFDPKKGVFASKMTPKWGVNGRVINDPKNRGFFTFPGGTPGKGEILKKGAAKLGGFFGFFREKMGFFGFFWRGGVSVIKRGTSIALR